MEFKVIQGHRSGCQSKAHLCNFLLATNSNFGRISYSFRDIDAFSSKIACFPTLLCLTPPSGGTPYQRNLYIAEKSMHLMGYNSVADIIGLSSLVLPLLPPKIAKSGNQAKFRQNLTLQQFKVIQSHRSWCQSKLTCDFLLVTNSNFSRICYRFRDIDA